MVPKLRIVHLVCTVVGERSLRAEAGRVTVGGVQRSENVGMSNRNTGEIPVHRKSKGSWATIIDPGLVGPKARPNGVVDGQQVNIPVPRIHAME